MDIDRTSYLNQNTDLSAEVAPFIPRSDNGKPFNDPMLPASGQLPHYLTSCYPFVQQDQIDGRQRMDSNQYQGYYNKDMSPWPMPPNNQFPPHMPSPRFNTPPPHIPPPVQIPPGPSDSLYQYHPELTYQSHPPFNGINNSFPHHLYSDNRSQVVHSHNHGHRYQEKRSDSKRSSIKKTNQRSVGIQMEVGTTDDGGDKIREMIDSSQQTDFPSDIANKSLSEKPSPLKKSRAARNRRRAAHSAAEYSVSCDSLSDHNGDEADVDSDSGYYSPKHQMQRKHNSVTSTHENRTEVGTTTLIPPSYPTNVVQPLVYLHPQAPNTYLQVHPHSYLHSQPLPGPGNPIRMPINGGPPLLMTPPPIINLGPSAPSPQQQALAIANFKRRTEWQQEILKAHNVAPSFPPPPGYNPTFPGGQFGAPNRFHLGPNLGRWKKQPLPKNNRRPTPKQNMTRNSSDIEADTNKREQSSERSERKTAKENGNPFERGHGLLHLNPNTAPPHLIQQNPPKLTDEDFPDLSPSNYYSQHGNITSISYSAAVQRKPPPPKINIPEDSPIKDMIEAVDPSPGKITRRRRKKAERAAMAAAQEYEGISKEQENIKKQLSKTGGNRKEGKSQQLNLAEMLYKLEQNQNDLHHKSFVPSKSAEVGNPTMRWKKDNAVVPHNPLDSSAPLKKRGKERENPKIKKPSALKKVILKEREEKKNNRLVTLSSEDNPEYDIPSLPPDILKPDAVKENADNNNSESNPSSATDNPSSQNASASGNSSPVVPSSVPKIHSRRYREYCCQVLDKQIDETCTIILQRLVQFQERMYQKDPMKAKSKRRFVLGLREVTKHLKLKKLKCVLISPNLEKIQSKGGLDDTLYVILQLCKTQMIPYVFALGRCAMGRAVSKLVPVSIIGIFDYSGVEDHYKRMIELVEEAQAKYAEMMASYQLEIEEANSQKLVPPPTKRFAHMGHSRNPSAASCVSFCSMISEPISEMNPLEGTSWRMMVDANDDSVPGPTLSPPPETMSEDEQANEENHADETLHVSNEISIDESADIEEDNVGSIHEEKDKSDNENSSEENGNSSHFDSYLNALDTSVISEDKVTTEQALDKSQSTVSTVVARTGKPEEKGGKSSRLSGKGSGITRIMEDVLPVSADTTDRINSWLEAATNSVQDLDLEDSTDDSKIEESLVPEVDREVDQENNEDDYLSCKSNEDEDDTKDS